MKCIQTPLSREVIKSLRAGEGVLLTGVIYTARDAAHKRMAELLASGMALPFDAEGQAIYYAGPCPAPPGRIIGSIGPTTSSRMDSYSPLFIKEGLRVMIGKGPRSQEVIDSIMEHTGIYFAAVGGAGAILSLCVKQAEIAAFEDLGTEAVYRLVVQDMPLVVAVDCFGDSLMFYKQNQQKE